jgi:hypothetical protein
MKAPPLNVAERILLTAIAAQFLFMAYLLVFGHWSGDATVAQGIVLFAIPAALGVASIILIFRRNPLGLFCCTILHALQLLQWTFENGARFNFSFFPTVTWRLNADLRHPVELNLLAVVLTLLSIIAWRAARVRGTASAAAAA